VTIPAESVKRWRNEREAMARVIYESDRRSYSADPEWDELNERDKEEYRVNADAAIRERDRQLREAITAMPDVVGEDGLLDRDDVLGLLEDE
jgi:hypothetical protein